MTAAAQHLSERYELGEILGFGGMAVVHLARDVRLHRDVAVKVLRLDLARDPGCYLRFRREAQNAAALNHPAIVAVYDTGATEAGAAPVPYIVMEYVDGVTLRDIVHDDGPMDPPQAIEVVADACVALDFSHQHGIIHRDVKPANIMISKTGAVKVMDFGIARALADTGNRLTETAAVIGTAHYLSPEQARGDTVDARSDVYSLGCVLYEILTGVPPFVGDSPVSVAYQHVREDPAPPSLRREGVSPELDAVILKALAKNPENRYQRAADMQTDLMRVQAGKAPDAPRVLIAADSAGLTSSPLESGRWQPTERIRTRRQGSSPESGYGTLRRWLTILAAVALLAAAVTFAIKAVGNRGLPARVPDVHGQTQQDAIAALQTRGFEIRGPISKPDASVPIGRVIDTEPGPGVALAGGDEITVNVSSGPEQHDIPDCVKLSVNDCARALADAGFDHIKQWPMASATVPPNEVIVTVPAAGQLSAVTIDIVIGVSTGPETRRVPDVSGQTVDQATTNLKIAGFPIILRGSIDSTLPKGRVVSTDPSPGTLLAVQSAIMLKVSLGHQFTMPNLIGLTYLEIVPILQGLNYQGPLLNDGDVPGTDDKRNRVVKQDPLPGTGVNRDDTITLNYGS
jgi:beta-lactam-binding protein with PASTA domain